MSRQFQDGLPSKSYLNLLRAVELCSPGKQMVSFRLSLESAVDGFSLDRIRRWCEKCAAVYEADQNRPVALRTLSIAVGMSPENALYGLLYE